jgi:branched-chain amino acid transport system permease protein
LSLGSVYALFASGFTLTLGVTRTFSFAHTVAFTLGAIVAIRLIELERIPPPLAACYGAMAAGVAGVVIDRIAGWPFRRRRTGPIAPMLAGVAAAALCYEIGRAIGHPHQWLAIPSTVRVTDLHIGSMSLYGPRLVALVACVGALLLIHVVLRGTRLGQAIRAVAGNESASRAVGMNVETVVALTMFAAALAGSIAGMASALLGAGTPYDGYLAQVPALAAVLMGGGRSIPGTVVAGFAIAVAEIAAYHLLPGQSYEFVPLALAIAALAVYPAGLMSSRALRAA